MQKTYDQLQAALERELAYSKKLNRQIDRGSQFDILQSVKGSYLWVSPMPFSVLAEHSLLQKQCQSATRYCDVFIHRSAQMLSNVEQGFLDVLRKDVAELVHA